MSSLKLKIWKNLSSYIRRELENISTPDENNINNIKTITESNIPAQIFLKLFLPYEKILDKQLWNDIDQNLISKINYFTRKICFSSELPPRAEEPKEPFSTIISKVHAAEISTWIDHEKDNYSTTNVPYKFELILREFKKVLLHKYFGISATVVRIQWL
ncbi:hypothetical protein Glove_117g241 [Diversispora epigaea]|uniref:Uncharacterized protein n=1 Tax=Diversispora epigaea TaxID=1348612 RepID=A0A397JA89_9GLOM|nr:hypothetical protein Glove_117g241 [Diversispora epigaea]